MDLVGLNCVDHIHKSCIFCAQSTLKVFLKIEVWCITTNAQHSNLQSTFSTVNIKKIDRKLRWLARHFCAQLTFSVWFHSWCCIHTKIDGVWSDPVRKGAYLSPKNGKKWESSFSKIEFCTPKVFLKQLVKSNLLKVKTLICGKLGFFVCQNHEPKRQ